MFSPPISNPNSSGMGGGTNRQRQAGQAKKKKKAESITERRCTIFPGRLTQDIRQPLGGNRMQILGQSPARFSSETRTMLNTIRAEADTELMQ